MAVRTDLTIDWGVSPRLITVASPSVEITIQDLLDTLREDEHDIENLGYDHLIDAAGKEPLGGGVQVGITASLNNAQLAFEARPGPGWVLCTISGGNLVAFDDVGSEIDPRSPTAFVTIDRTSSSSATLADISSLQAASFDGGVAIQTGSLYSGTSFPVGTRQAPVNNTTDAISIADGRGLKLFYVIDNLTLTSEDFSNGYIFQGDNPVISRIDIETAANVADCEFVSATVDGVLDNNNNIRSCIVESVNYFNGVIIDSGLKDTITLGGGVEAHIVNCHTADIATPPVIDMGGSGQSLIMSGYAGEFSITNKTGASDEVVCDLNSGNITIDNTVTDGTVTLRGVGLWANKDTYSGGATIVNELIDGTFVQQLDYAAFNDEIHIDQANGTSGTAFPLGTGRSPVDNVTDAVTIATAQGIQNLRFVGDYTFISGDNVALCHLYGSGAESSTLTFVSGVVTAGTHFNDMTVEGTLISPQGFHNCRFNNVVGETIGGVGTMLVVDCWFTGTITLSASLEGEIHLVNCSSGVPGNGTPVFDSNGANVDVLARGYSGGMEVRNFSNVAANEMSLDFASGRLTIADTCTTGEIIVRGVASWANKSTYAGTTTVTNELIEPDDVQSTAIITRNKIVTDPDTGLLTLYDTDGTTILLQANVYEDVAKTIPYRGRGVSVVEHKDVP